MEETNSMLKTVGSFFEQIRSWPVSLVLGISLVVLSTTLRSLRIFPNRYVIPVVLLLGGLANMLLADSGQIAPTQRYPYLLMFMWGMLIAFFALVAHGIAVAKFGDRFPWLKGLAVENGDTTIIRKPKE